jgi:hypothetical protein
VKRYGKMILLIAIAPVVASYVAAFVHAISAQAGSSRLHQSPTDLDVLGMAANVRAERRNQDRSTPMGFACRGNDTFSVAFIAVLAPGQSPDDRPSRWDLYQYVETGWPVPCWCGGRWIHDVELPNRAGGAPMPGDLLGQQVLVLPWKPVVHRLRINVKLYLAVTVPSLLVVLLIDAMRLLEQRRREAERRRATLCPHCGYDLRMLTSDRCPECGNTRVSPWGAWRGGRWVPARGSGPDVRGGEPYTHRES